jgi:hypothetical protein
MKHIILPVVFVAATVLFGCSSTEPSSEPHPLVAAWNRHVATARVGTAYRDTVVDGIRSEWIITSTCPGRETTGVPYRFGNNAFVAQDGVERRYYRHMLKLDSELFNTFYPNYIGSYELRTENGNVYIAIVGHSLFRQDISSCDDNEGAIPVPRAQIFAVDSTRIVTDLWTARRVR